MVDREDRFVLITSVGGLSRLSSWHNSHGRWLYLGKDVRLRAQVESLLGAESRVRLGDGLHQTAADLRQSFLDLVAEISAEQHDQIGWWSTAFSWKVSPASDLFLLACYLSLAHQLIQESVTSGTRLAIVAEDPWLLRQLEEKWAADPGVHVSIKGHLWPRKVQVVSLGIAKRARWLFKVLWHYCRQRWTWLSGRMRVPTRAAIAIYSFPMARCLRDGGAWEDPFLPGLDQFLKNLGYDVIRFTPPQRSGLENQIAVRRNYFHPLILYATVGGVFRSLVAFWWPRWPRQLSINGMSIQRLVERERWLEVGRSSLCFYRLFYECSRKMLRRGEWRWIVYPYENQPWEKMISLCAQERGIRTAGIQHSTLATSYMSYFLGTGEAQHMPLPDVICVSGPYPHKLLASGGNPIERLKMCGSIRYNHLTNSGENGSFTELNPAPQSEVLVALPIDIHMARHVLAAIRSAFPTGGREEGLRFHIKAHPMSPVSPADVGFPALEAPHDINAALQTCGLVLFASTTVGPEAMALGRMVLRYRPELLLDLDPSEVYGDSIPTCTDANLREAVLSLVRSDKQVVAVEDTLTANSQIFAPVNWRMLEDIFRLAR